MRGRDKAIELGGDEVKLRALDDPDLQGVWVSGGELGPSRHGRTLFHDGTHRPAFNGGRESDLDSVVIKKIRSLALLALKG